MSVKPCLLVVDDEPDLVQSVKDLLRFDFRVLGATRASEGLRIAESEDIHVVMSDQRMPEMTGVEFLAALKQSHPDIVRLLFTGYSDLKAVTDAINQGNVYRYISKPFQSDELKAVLRQAVEHFHLQTERKKLLQEVQEMNRLLEDANRELRQGNELKRAFIKVASHELRTPLTIMVGLTELARTSNGGGPPKGWIEHVHDASLRLRQRVDQMVTFLQTEKFERTLQPSEVDFAELVQTAGEEVRNFVARRKQTLVIDLPPDLGTLDVEADKIHDSLVQLLVNAIKFTPDGGTIKLSARREKTQAEIVVQDNGMGMEPESLARIFDPFFTKFDVSHHRSGTFEFGRRGLGLGLPLVKAFVEMHGGKVKVESAVDKGTTVRITLPLGEVVLGKVTTLWG